MVVLLVLVPVWKQGMVVPIYKKGDKHDPGNYRPVSLTSVPCKILESLIRDELMQYLTTHNLLAEEQHGFHPGRSCNSQLLETVDAWSRLLESGTPIDVVYLDFKKAFDSVPHMRLLSKLQSYGISGKLLEWIQSFLSDRMQQVTLGGCRSGFVPVTSGDLKGLCLAHYCSCCMLMTYRTSLTAQSSCLQMTPSSSRECHLILMQKQCRRTWMHWDPGLFLGR